MKTFALEDIGGGRSRGLAAAKKARVDMLQRMSLLGQGLSAAQRNDWAWFKAQWDAKMLAGHGDAWPKLLCRWLQHIIGQIELGVRNAFSVFVHNATVGCFSD